MSEHPYYDSASKVICILCFVVELVLCIRLALALYSSSSENRFWVFEPFWSIVKCSECLWTLWGSKRAFWLLHRIDRLEILRILLNAFSGHRSTVQNFSGKHILIVMIVLSRRVVYCWKTYIQLETYEAIKWKARVISEESLMVNRENNWCWVSSVRRNRGKCWGHKQPMISGNNSSKRFFKSRVTANIIYS